MRTLAVLLAAAFAAAPARAGALRDAALAVVLARENASPEGRRAALDLAFDASAFRQDAEAPAADAPAGPRRSWFPKRRPAPEDRAVLRIPELPAFKPEAGLTGRAGEALSAALAPWRALADAAWGGAFSGMVAVGLAERAH